MCEDDVVARGVSAATTGCGRAGEAEFEDHVGSVICRVLAIGMRINQCRRLRVAPTICGPGMSLGLGCLVTLGDAVNQQSTVEPLKTNTPLQIHHNK